VITFAAVEVGIRVEQWCKGPTVYLDHWAWRRISEDPGLASAFASGLAAIRGTVAMSWLNLVEFAKVSYLQQRRKADWLLDQILPNVFFVDLDFFKVAEAEDSLLGGGVPEPPHSDLASLRMFAKLNLLRTDTLELLPSQRLFETMAQTGIEAKFDAFADSIVQRVRSMQRDYASNAEFRGLVKELPKSAPMQRGTRLIAREVLRGFFTDCQTVTKNDAVDVCHVIVPTAYCDFVLLDGRWEEQVERARKRFKKAGLVFPIARTYSERRGGLARFIRDLDSWAQDG
jgi:hypothetical protein